MRSEEFIESLLENLSALKKSAKTIDCGVKLASTREASHQPNVHRLAHSFGDRIAHRE